MAKLVRHANGNVVLHFDPDEERKPIEQILPKLEPVAGIRMANGNVWLPPQRRASPDEETQVLDAEKAAGVEKVETPKQAPKPWPLKVSAGTYLRRYGIDSEHSALALAHLNLTVEAWAEITGAKLPGTPEEPAPEGGTDESAPSDEAPPV